jgi:hypothetical protein
MDICSIITYLVGTYLCKMHTYTQYEQPYLMYTHMDCSMRKRLGRSKRQHCGRVTILQHLLCLQVAILYTICLPTYLMHLLQ